MRAARTPAPAATKQSFATPKATLEEYVAALAANDLDATIRESAIDDIVTRSDYGARARYIGMLPPINLDAPSKYAMYVRMNRAGPSRILPPERSFSSTACSRT